MIKYQQYELKVTVMAVFEEKELVSDTTLENIRLAIENEAEYPVERLSELLSYSDDLSTAEYGTEIAGITKVGPLTMADHAPWWEEGDDDDPE